MLRVLISSDEDLRANPIGDGGSIFIVRNLWSGYRPRRESGCLRIVNGRNSPAEETREVVLEATSRRAPAADARHASWERLRTSWETPRCPIRTKLREEAFVGQPFSGSPKLRESAIVVRRLGTR